MYGNIEFYCSRCGELNSHEPDSNNDLSLAIDGEVEHQLEILNCTNCGNPFQVHVSKDPNSLNFDYHLNDGYKLGEEESEYQAVFKSAVFNLDQLTYHLLSENYVNNTYFNRLFYTQCIITLETYFGDALRCHVLSSDEYIKKFILTSEKLKNETYSLKLIIQKPNLLEDIVTSRLSEILYHNLGVVSKIYMNVLDIDLQKLIVNERRYFETAILIRHDCVHRSGKTKDGKAHYISRDDIQKLAISVSQLILNLHDAMQYLDVNISENIGGISF
ncbi:hypothetical protein [Pseudoalteromonas sp. S558]|uniref:hypothetical protein n=1 Tax=Pseudoalteromonas sp. S558 TaxID=2066515 RepID=UPI00110A365F|nr:hypothetical protein [Pseudoalteromonas sp. S558]TMO10910.1 hypothetical protein CWB66_00300 [Pseudoalteromonas sp. S558]